MIDESSVISPNFVRGRVYLQHWKKEERSGLFECQKKVGNETTVRKGPIRAGKARTTACDGKAITRLERALEFAPTMADYLTVLGKSILQCWFVLAAYGEELNKGGSSSLNCRTCFLQLLCSSVQFCESNRRRNSFLLLVSNAASRSEHDSVSRIRLH